MESPEIPSPDTIDQAMEWMYRLGALRAALELRLWEKISANGETAAGLAAREGWNFHGTRSLLDALCAYGLMTRRGDQYLPSTEARQYLVSGAAAYLGDMLLNEIHWEADGRLAEGIRTGKRLLKYNVAAPGSTPLWKAFYSRNLALPGAFLERSSHLWQSLGVMSRPGLRVLDIACGPTPRSLSLAKDHPGVRLAWVDWEDVLHYALNSAEEMGVDVSQVTLLPGSLWEQEFGTGYDVAFLGNVTHFFSPEENTRLFRKIYETLVPGKGMIAISAVRRDMEGSAWDGLWLYAASASGGAHDFEEYRAMLMEAGFTAVEDVGQGPIKAVKPS